MTLLHNAKPLTAMVVHRLLVDLAQGFPVARPPVAALALPANRDDADHDGADGRDDGPPLATTRPSRPMVFRAKDARELQPPPPPGTVGPAEAH